MEKGALLAFRLVAHPSVPWKFVQMPAVARENEAYRHAVAPVLRRLPPIASGTEALSAARIIRPVLRQSDAFAYRTLQPAWHARRYEAARVGISVLVAPLLVYDKGKPEALDIEGAFEPRLMNDLGIY